MLSPRGDPGNGAQAFGRTRNLVRALNLADVSRSGFNRHHRRRCGPSLAPASVQSAIVPPYQSATKGNESAVQWSA